MPKPSLKVKSVSRRSSNEEEENSSIAKSSGGAGLTIGSVVPGGNAEDCTSVVDDW